LVNGKVEENKFEVHHTSESESSDPPPYVLPVRSAALASPRSESNAGDSNGRRKHWAQTPIHVTQWFPHYTPPLPPTTPKEEKSHLGRSLNSGRLTSKDRGAPVAILCPLHQVPGLPLTQADRSYAAGPMQYVYQLFTNTDLLNW
jgi:hypothetical protein